jgi:hypothetical protein
MNTRFVRYFSISLAPLLSLLTAERLSAGEPAKKRPRLDSHGDPLPPLARLRIGTTRFQHSGERKSCWHC